MTTALTRNEQERRFVTVVDGIITSESWEREVLSRRVRTTWQASSRTRVTTTKLGRSARVVQDALARPVQLQVGDLLPTSISYDADGR
ncbi:MAG TPA: hypothetical protein VJM14_04765, partial [Burkholderiales bacterium]|nr:hypothetical protein [Burkholderiales bacterium]